jgi:ketosteroid isomerase-like protein
MPNDNHSRLDVKAVLDALSQGLRNRDAQAVARLFAPDAQIFDLAPPLAHSLDAHGLADWLAGWDGPVDQSVSGLEVQVSGDLALCHGLVRVQTIRGGEDVSWWMRATYALVRDGHGWRIIHEHTSVPFYMDGSYRAAIDLQP